MSEELPLLIQVRKLRSLNILLIKTVVLHLKIKITNYSFIKLISLALPFIGSIYLCHPIFALYKQHLFIM